MKSNLDGGRLSSQETQRRDQFKQAFGRELRRRMLAKGWNQSDLARVAGIGRDAVSTYVNGRSFPEPLSLHKLAEAFGCTVDELLPDHAAPESVADFTIQQSADDPGLVRVTINKPITLSLAAEIVDKLRTGKK